jgi:hypothetical protein
LSQIHHPTYSSWLEISLNPTHFGSLSRKVSFKSTQEIDDVINKLTNIIQSAAWEATPSQAQFSNNSFSIPEHIRILIANKRKARVLFQRSHLPSHKHKFNNLANSLKKILAKHKNQLQINYLTNLSPNKMECH